MIVREESLSLRQLCHVLKTLVVLAVVAAACEATAQEMQTSRGSALAPIAPQSVTTWTTGLYQYDGAGNITAIGSDSFAYDEVNRVVRATAGAGHEQQYTYDAAGNITGITTDGDTAAALRFGVDPKSNRIDQTHDASGQPYNAYGGYDGAGNMTSRLDIETFAYDGAGAMTESTISGIRRLFLYSPAEERLATVTLTGGAPSDYRWTLRDDGGKVLREVRKVIGSGGAASWQWNEDYVYRDGTLLAAEVSTPERTLHFHTDHLGTPRLITGNGGAKVGLHAYYAFGREVSEPSQDIEKMKFTGHERDMPSLDYMHARYYSAMTGRFLSVDPALDPDRAVRSPQMWNRYTYAVDNPIAFTDPTGTTVYVVLYTMANSEANEELRRAAETRALEIQNGKFFDPKTDTVLIRGVATKEDFGNALANANALGARYGKVGELNLFSHSGKDGPVFHDLKGKFTQFTASEVSALRVNWESNACAHFFGCNTGNKFSQVFAAEQHVTSYGQPGYAYFSASPLERVPIAPTGPVYMISAPGVRYNNTPAPFQWLNLLSGHTTRETMIETHP